MFPRHLKSFYIRQMVVKNIRCKVALQLSQHPSVTVTSYFDVNMEEILHNLKTSQILRISCSDIAGVTGFNPWSKIDELFEKYLYQDLDELMVQDAENLDTEFLTTEQEIQKILQKIDVKDKLELEALDSVTKDSTVLNSHVKAEDMLKQIQQLMKESGIVSKISTTELKFIENEFRGRVRKNYGIHCENTSLDKYEHVIGFPVVERNMETVKMKVMPLQSQVESNSLSRAASLGAASSLSESVEDYSPVDAFAVLLNGSKRQSKEQALAAALGVKKRRAVVRPSFVLVGRVDGISYQLDMSSDDPAQWTKANKVVVEMKNRVRSISSPPPLYEQIQLVSYMIMLDCPYGDLVQAMARKDTPRAAVSVSTAPIEQPSSAELCIQTSDSVSVCTTQESSSSQVGGNRGVAEEASFCSNKRTTTCAVETSGDVVSCSSSTVERATHIISGSSVVATNQQQQQSDIVAVSTTSTTTSTSYTQKPKAKKNDPTMLYGEEDFQVNRIHLDGPPYHHRKYWENVIMPRLRLFRDAVAVLRSDDSLRYAYLMSAPEEKVKILQNLCPYIDL